MLNQTSDGHSWTKESGLRVGNFACEGVIVPSQHLERRANSIYDAIVIGAGYAGLSAARDLASAGRSVLLVEGRDRVGGRTYTVHEDGFKFEMGGTWVSHVQPYTFRELVRYGLDRDLAVTRHEGFKNDYFSLKLHAEERKDFSQERAAELTSRAWNIFVNVDGESGRKICPLPYQQLSNIRVTREEVEKWDSYSSYDRLQEVKDQLSEDEMGLLIPILLIIHGGNPDLKTSAFWDIVQAHALNGYRFENLDQIWFTYKLQRGQSRLARSMFDEAAECGLDYAFKTAVHSLQETSDGLTRVSTQDGRSFQGKTIICTVPLNVLKSLRFEPPLSPLRQEAVDLGHINFMTKIHAVIEGSGMASWNGTAYPNDLVCAYGDGVLPSGDAHLVVFGTDERSHFVPEDHPEKAVQAIQNFHPMKVKKLVFHNWNTDPFSKAGPCWWSPGYMSKYQDELQSRHGNIFFASADWAHGWRAFIDGALEQGFLNALEVLRQLRGEGKSNQSQRLNAELNMRAPRMYRVIKFEPQFTYVEYCH